VLYIYKVELEKVPTLEEPNPIKERIIPRSLGLGDKDDHEDPKALMKKELAGVVLCSQF
jgi:hypothetical protein